MFNGYPDQYVHAPLTAKVGERVRWWVVAAGAGRGHGLPHRRARSSTPCSRRAPTSCVRATPSTARAQVLDLAPAQGGFVEQTFTEPGHYAIVDHDMSRGENGARGIVEVTR